MRNKITAAKNFVVAHKMPIAITTTFLATTALTARVYSEALDEHNEFLKENDLFDTYYETH